MAIFTRHGNEVEVVGYNHDTGAVEIKYRNGRFDDVAIYELNELKADGGIQEIDEAIKKF